MDDRVQPNGEFKFAPASTPLWECSARSGVPSVLIPSSLPLRKRNRILFRTGPHGELTPTFTSCKSATKSDAQSSKGRFTSIQERAQQSLLVSTVTGIAPFVSYIRTLHKEWKEGKFAGSKDYSAQWRQPLVGFGYLDELRKFADEVRG